MEKKEIESIVVVDIETTGLKNYKDYIVEIGIVELNLSTGETTVLYDELVKEEGFDKSCKNSWVFKNTDLTIKQIMEASPLDVKSIQEIFNQYFATAFNKKFDFGFLKYRGLKIKELPCPMLISTNICKLKNNYRAGFKWPKVQEAWDFFFGKETGYVEKHRGCDDAIHEAQIVYRLYELGHIEII